MAYVFGTPYSSHIAIESDAHSDRLGRVFAFTVGNAKGFGF